MSFVPLLSFVHTCYTTHPRPGTGGLISLLTGEQPAAQPTQTLTFCDKWCVFLFSRVLSAFEVDIHDS